MDDKVYTYDFNDIFQDIPDDPDNVNMVLPPDVMQAAGIKEGDTIEVRLTDNGQLIIKKAKNGEE